MRARWVLLIIVLIALFPAAAVDVCREATLAAVDLFQHAIDTAG